MWIVVSGNPVDGLTFIGPFPDRHEAIEWGERDDRDLWDWWVAPLDPIAPEKP